MGLRRATLRVCPATVAVAINKVASPTSMQRGSNNQLSMRNGKRSNQLSITQMLIGQAMRLATRIGIEHFHSNNLTMSLTLAPSALRRPISLVRFSTVKVARPYIPRHAMSTARAENPLIMCMGMCSVCMSERMVCVWCVSGVCRCVWSVWCVRCVYGYELYGCAWCVTSEWCVCIGVYSGV